MNNSINNDMVRLDRVEREIISLAWRLAELREEQAEIEERLGDAHPEWLAERHEMRDRDRGGLA